MYGKLALCFIGLSSGGVIAAGIFAFLAIIGVFPRLIGVTHKMSCDLYETLLILGGTAGNLMDLFHLPLAGAGTAFLALWGLALGVFVGCLVMSLAETLKALPVLGRRLGLAVGIQYLILSIAAGKFVGAMVYFSRGFGGN
ncbi:MAG: stage V sporulation protein AB [Enterocloster sp.]